MSEHVLAPDDGESPVMYSARRLIADGFVRNETDLYRKIKSEGFPRQVKAGVTGRRVEWHGPSVRAWHRAKLARMQEDIDATPRQWMKEHKAKARHD